MKINIDSNFINIDGFKLKKPAFEVDGKEVSPINLVEKTTGEECRKCEETVYKFDFEIPDLYLLMRVRDYKSAPFIRFKYEFEGDGYCLTKTNGKDNISYFSVCMEDSDVYEIQFSQYESIMHSYMPNIECIDKTLLALGYDFMGPISLLDFGRKTLILAYEHGSTYPEKYLEFSAMDGDIAINAYRGNYFSGQPVDKFMCPWFEIGVCENPLEDYRDFMLNHIAENDASRMPYIFYNTWNNQERVQITEGSYLAHLTLPYMLKEIEIAHKMGIEVFVIDTGWYERCGDWNVSPERFPDGLKTIKETLDRYGMRLGIWFNPCAAAVSSQVYKDNPKWLKNDELWSIWETEESGTMCLASDYADWFADKLIEVYKTTGATYFKWDAIDMTPCMKSNHNHGTQDNTAEEINDNFKYQLPLKMVEIVEKVAKACPEIIVDFDITEKNRCVGLAFLTVGKYFLMNNGPYYADLDVPEEEITSVPNINVFLHKGEARNKVCKQFVKFDKIVPSVLFLTHFFPDEYRYTVETSIASLVLGANGIWGDILSLDDATIAKFAESLSHYKKVRAAVTKAYPKVTGFIGSSPEIYEKIDKCGGGLISFFTNLNGSYTYITQGLESTDFTVVGADSYEFIKNRIKLNVKLENNEGRVVYIIRN